MSNVHFGRVYRVLPIHDTEAAQQFADHKIAKGTPAKAGTHDCVQYVYTNEPNADGTDNNALDIFTRYEEELATAQEAVSFVETVDQLGLDPAVAPIAEFMDTYRRAEDPFNSRMDLRYLEDGAIDVFKRSNDSFSLPEPHPRASRRERRQGLQRKGV